MTVVQSLIVLIFGLIASMLAICLDDEIERTGVIDEEPKRRGETNSMDERRVLEYQTLNAEVGRRSEIITGIAGTLFVATSFLLLGQSALNNESTIRFEMALGGLGVYSFWYFAYGYSSNLLDAITFNRLHELEIELDIVAHRYVRWHSKKEFGKRLRLRQLSWAILLLLETLVAAYLVFP